MSSEKFSGDALAQAKREITAENADPDAALYALAFAAMDIAESLRTLAKWADYQMNGAGQ